MQDISEMWLHDLQEKLHREPLVTTDVRIGVFYTAVRLSSGHVGVAFTCLLYTSPSPRDS